MSSHHSLNADEIARYARHFPVIGLNGQKQLKQSKVLCIGAGGLGAPVLQYLAAAGIGHITLVDGDSIDKSNLQRQILFSEEDVGKSKSECTINWLKKLNSQISLNAINTFLTRNLATEIFKDFDVIIDATDNYQARYLINEMSRLYQVPLVSASIFQFDAQISVFNYENGPCYQCLYPEPPPKDLTPNCAIGGVLGVLPGVAGTLQANEVIKVLLKKGHILSGELLSIDLLNHRYSSFKISKQNCQNHPQVNFEEDDNKSIEKSIEQITANSLANLLKSDAKITLIDVREDYEREICHIGGLHIPLNQLPDSLSELSKTDNIITYCKAGVRGLRACETLKNAGFANTKNLEGGIIAWINTIEPSLMTY